MADGGWRTAFSVAPSAAAVRVCQDAGSGQGGGHAGQAQPAAQVHHPPAGQGLAGRGPGQGDAGRPHLGPEGQAVLVRVVLGQELVQDGVAVTGTEDAYRPAGEEEGLLDNVGGRARRQPGRRRQRRMGSGVHGVKLP